MGLDPRSRPIYGIRGGRHLDAISLNPNLNVYEKAVLHAIASQMDVNGDYDDERWMYIADIARRTSISRRQVFRTLAGLVKVEGEKEGTPGYLKRQQQRSSETGKNAASLYRFTSRLFTEFEAMSNVKLLHGASWAVGGG